jgi:hypothetical protein
MGGHDRRDGDNRPKASPEQMGADFDRHHEAYVARHQARSEGGEVYDHGAPADGSGAGGGGFCAPLFFAGLASLAALGWPAAHAVHLLF